MKGTDIVKRFIFSNEGIVLAMQKVGNLEGLPYNLGSKGEFKQKKGVIPQEPEACTASS